ATGVWTATGTVNTSRGVHTATLLNSGLVLVAGGINYNPTANILASAELYDPATGVWTVSGSMRAARDFHTATLLPNRQVLVAGGETSCGGSCTVITASAERYTP